MDGWASWNGHFQYFGSVYQISRKCLNGFVSYFGLCAFDLKSACYRTRLMCCWKFHRSVSNVKWPVWFQSMLQKQFRWLLVGWVTSLGPAEFIGCFRAGSFWHQSISFLLKHRSQRIYWREFFKFGINIP